MLHAFIRKALAPLKTTPLHPQWFAYRHERQRYEEVGRLATGRVLDIGCGRQPLRTYLNASCDYVSLDYPNTSRALYDAQPHIFGDAHRLPFADGTFDTIVLLEVLEHFPEPETAIREARRVLAEGGQLIISTHFLYPIHDAPRDYRRWTRHGLEHLASSSGFVVEQLHALGDPVESGVLLLNLGLAWQTLHAPVVVRLPLLLLSVLAIPLLNLLAVSVSFLCKHAVIHRSPPVICSWFRSQYNE